MTFLEALMAIRPLIASKEQEYICYALSRVGASQYCGLIEGQLRGLQSYDGWLFIYHRDFYAERGNDVTPGRLAWIDDMIKRELEK